MKAFYFLLLCSILGFGSSPAYASKAQDVQQAENYLKNLETVRARFIQVAPNGTQKSGVFYLSRPGKLRFEYNPPENDFVVADGTFIYFYDADLQEQSHAPIGETLADFILRKDISLKKEVQVLDVSRAAGLLQITLQQKADPLAGNLKLGFQEDPFRLKKWRVTDAQGMITEIILSELETGIQLNRDLFFYRNPNHKPYDFNQ